MPYVSTPFELKSSPSSFLKTDSSLGYSLAEGNYKVSINGLEFNASHNSNSQRNVLGTKVQKDVQVIALFGCSFAYGFAVNDSFTVASKLQSMLNDQAQIKSFAVPGYGDVQGYLQLKQLIKEHKAPDIAVFGYCPFHNERNVLSAKYRIHIAQGLGANYVEGSSCKFPKCKVKEDDLCIDYEPVNDVYNHWWGRGYSSIINLLQSVYDLLVYPAVSAKETGVLYNNIVSLCNANDIEIIIAPHATTSNFSAIEKYIVDDDYALTKERVDLDDPTFNNQPFDSHPNALGYQKMAESIYKCILAER